MARNFFGFLAKNKPVQRFRKTNNIPTANWLKQPTFESLTGGQQIQLEYCKLPILLKL